MAMNNSPKRTVIKSARPNGWPIYIVQYEGDSAYQYYVEEPDADGCITDGEEFELLADAEEYFERRRTELAKEPNWELQRQYDEEHGTDSGFSPWDYQSREY